MSTTSSHRLGAQASASARIDRNRPLNFTVDGKAFTGFAGDTVASAMLGAGVKTCGPSLYLNRPRGIMSSGVEEANALVKIGARYAGHVNESMLPATAVELTDGMDVTLLSGLGQLDPRADEAVYDRKYVHTDVLIVGAGPAGLVAAREAAKSGARVILVDEQPEAGGSLLSASTETIDGKPAATWIAETREALKGAEEFTYLARTTAFGSYDANFFVAVQRRTDHLAGELGAGVSRERIWHIRAAQVVLATGAHERPLVFENNDRPGIMLAGAARVLPEPLRRPGGQRDRRGNHQRLGLRAGRGPARRRHHRCRGHRRPRGTVDPRHRGLRPGRPGPHRFGGRGHRGARRRFPGLRHRQRHRRRRRADRHRRNHQRGYAGGLRRLEPGGAPALAARTPAGLERIALGLRPGQPGAQPADRRRHERPARAGLGPGGGRPRRRLGRNGGGFRRHRLGAQRRGRAARRDPRALAGSLAGRRERRPTSTTSWTSSATRPLRTCCAPPVRACARSST